MKIYIHHYTRNSAQSVISFAILKYFTALFEDVNTGKRSSLYVGSHLADFRENSDLLYHAIPCTNYKFIRDGSILEGPLQEEQYCWEYIGSKRREYFQNSEFFPNVTDRLKMKISINPNFTAMVTGHGRTRAYRYRFRLIDNAACPCNKQDQTVDHLKAAFLKLWSAEHKWSSGSALVVLLD